jgi:hypothetical protein
MIRSAAGKVAWVGRTASMVFGLALVLALVVGAATAAFGADGDFFRVGKSNLATAVSTLTNSGVGPALRLKVDSGAPLAVNSSGKVAKLNADKLDGSDSTDFVSGSGSVTSIDERFSDPDGPGEFKGLSNSVSVPGAQLYAACLQQSSGVELLLDQGNVSGPLTLWRDDGGANPSAKTVGPPYQESSPVAEADRVIWHGSSTAGTFTAVLFTRYEGGNFCHWSGYVLSNQQQGSM